METIGLALLGIAAVIGAGLATQWIPRPARFTTRAAVVLLAACGSVMFVVGQAQEQDDVEPPSTSETDHSSRRAGSPRQVQGTDVSLPAPLERTVIVPGNLAVGADARGFDTRIMLMRGQIVHISASGTVVYGYQGGESGDCEGFAQTDADGNRTIAGAPCGTKIDNETPLPAAPLGALIGRVGSGPWFLVGGQHTFQTDRDGNLWLAPNDQFTGDNRGYYAVELWIDG